ncbi:ComEC/Rec2 family competence protein [Paenibacillus cremeus]|uniref:MBL fold metallo-hydrolase n=1 Tax=Paenibacillus cremeus TaxID=2163881 RepID=A0A559K014_9BACL|nr:MBL fold metallo-hydrolase [Paenibacillus cremeus]TVY05437.1 MBL fold metallo-hydrolase [Paenibacillus cremeus]
MKHGTKLKILAAVAISAVLIAVAWTKVDIEPKQTATAVEPAGAPAQEQKKEEAPLRTKEVFDRAKDKGLLTIRYFNLKDLKVATGDSYLITSPDGQTMLMDAGIPETGKQVVGYLDQLGIQTLDIAFNTHPHSDHLGGFAEVLKVKNAKAYYMENFQYTVSGAYRNVMTQVEKKRIPIRTLEEGDTFELGSDVKFEVLSPKKGVLPEAIHNYDPATLNYYALVVKMTYKNNTFLFPADIYKDREAELIALYGNKLDTDFVHAPHHGNNTSSSPSFVDTVSPKITVLSSNIFNSLDVLKRYERKGSAVYSTGLNGNILITSDGERLNVITEKDRVPTK